MLSIYSYGDYKAFILDKIQASPNEGRGIKTALSNAINCQKPYLTHVLKGDAHFNADQAILSARYFGLNPAETDYLLHLVLSERAAQQDLRAYYQGHLNSLLNEYYLMKNRVKIKAGVSNEFKSLYYSSWHFAAIHMLATIPDCRTLERIRTRLKLSEEKTKSVLDFLIRSGLVRQEADEYLPTEKVIFLGADEHQIVWHHKNWRNKASEYIEQNDPTNLHASFVLTLSKRDFITIREQMKTSIADVMQKVKDSKEEEITCLCVDFFVL
jgi:uncharacterized protein (TIGR02147 family)